MRAMLLSTCSVLAACTVEGGKDVPLVVGEGPVQVDPKTQQVKIDPAQVPVVGACADGQFVRRTAAGWECAALPATFPTTWAQVGGVTGATEWPGTVPLGRITGATASSEWPGTVPWDRVTGRPDVDGLVAALDARVERIEGKPAGGVVAASCAALFALGLKTSGPFTIDPSGTDPFTAYCDMEGTDGGWTMVFNSVLAPGTSDFWRIKYAQRFGRRGTPSLARNFYDGRVYLFGRTYRDDIEDLHEKRVVAFVATTTGINTTNMHFNSPVRVSGDNTLYLNHFAGGWSAPDFDSDANGGNCALGYQWVTQHYANCWAYNLGSDADAPTYDGGVGPHAHAITIVAMGLDSDTDNGGGYSRVRRITRFAKW